MSLMTMLSYAVWGPYGPPRASGRHEPDADRTSCHDGDPTNVDRPVDEHSGAPRELVFWQSPAARSDRRPWSSLWAAR